MAAYGIVSSMPSKGKAGIPSKQFACNLLSEMLPLGSKRAKYLFLQKFNLMVMTIPSTFSTDLWTANRC